MFVAITLLAVTSLSAMPDGGTRAAQAGAASAKALNAEGYALYKAQRWQEAADTFKEAFTENPKLALAHYNFAATVFAASQADGCSPLTYSFEEALAHLERSIRLDPKRLKRLREDPDFEGFRGTARYFALLGVDIHSRAGLTSIFPKMRFTAPSGHDHPFHRFQFRDGGVVEVEDRDDGYEWITRRGTWRIHLRPADGGGRRVLELEVKVPGTSHARPLQFRAPIQVGTVSLQVAEPASDPLRPILTDGWAECCC